MSTITQIPKELSSIIPKFDGDESILNLFIRKCEYVIRLCREAGNLDQDLYIFQVITSKLVGRAATLISERPDIESWNDLKTTFEQHFGDPRSEECIAIELETLKINNGESYLDFCVRIQHIKSTLLAKVNRIADVSLRKSKITIYNHMAMNVFLYNLPEDLLRIVRLKGCDSLENALSIVLEEVNFLHQYQTRNKMLRLPNNTQHKPQTTSQNSFTDKTLIRPFLTHNTQPLQHNFKFGIPQNIPYPKPNLNQPNFYQTSQQPRFKFGIPHSKQIKLPIQQTHQFGNRPQFHQNSGYKPQFGTPQFGYKPNFNQAQQPTGYRPPPHLQRPQFQPRIQSTDVSMRTAPPLKPQGFRMNEIYNINDNDDDTHDDIEYYHDADYTETNDENSYYEQQEFADHNEQDVTNAIENFHIGASNRLQK